MHNNTASYLRDNQRPLHINTGARGSSVTLAFDASSNQDLEVDFYKIEKLNNPEKNLQNTGEN